MGNTPGGLPYNLGEAVDSYRDKNGWTLYKGTSKADKSSCSIFKYDPKKAIGNSSSSAENALKLAKTMKHPNVVRCLDGIATPSGEILIITEPVIPLLDWLTETKSVETSKETFANAVTLGLSGIVRALSFLNNDVSICHGLISHDSVFVTPGGDWKLSRFDIAGKLDNEFLDRHQLLNKCYQSPERVNQDRSTLRNMPLHAIDAWSFGVLLRTVYGGEVRRTEDLQNCGCIPKGLTQAYQKLLKSAPEKRINIKKLISLKYFQTELVKSMLFLEEIMIKTPEEKFYFFQSLTNNLDEFPQHVCKYKILPELTASLSLGATSGETSMGVAGPVVLVPLLKLGTMLNNDEYTKHVTPVVLKMFEQQDRGIRVALLSSLPQLVESIDSDLFNTKIFQHICTGFTDTAPQMRELTLKSLPILAPILTENVMNTQLKKVLNRSLQDPVPQIRTNATVCLGMLCNKFKNSKLIELCIPSFTRALRDSFPHNRERALHSIKVTINLYSDVDLGTKLMPHICPSCVDPIYEVRNTAFNVLFIIQEKLKLSSEKREKEDEIKREEMKHQKSMGSDSLDSNTLSSMARSSGGGGDFINKSNKNVKNENSNSTRKSTNFQKSAGNDFNFDMWDDDDNNTTSRNSSSSNLKKVSKIVTTNNKKSKEERKKELEERKIRLKKERDAKKAGRAKKSGGMQLGGGRGGMGGRNSGSSSSRSTPASSLSGLNIGWSNTSSGSKNMNSDSHVRDEDSNLMDTWGNDEDEEHDLHDLLDFSDDEDEEKPKLNTKIKITKKTSLSSAAALADTPNLLDDGGGWGDIDGLDDLLSSSPNKKIEKKQQKERKKVLSLAERKAERERKKKLKDSSSKKKKKNVDDDWGDDW